MAAAASPIQIAGQRLGLIITTVTSGAEKAKSSLQQLIEKTSADVFPPSLKSALVEIILSPSDDKAARIEAAAKQHIPTVVIPKPVQKGAIMVAPSPPKFVQLSAERERKEAKGDEKSLGACQSHCEYLEPLIDLFPFVDGTKTKLDTQKMIALLLKGIPDKVPAIESEHIETAMQRFPNSATFLSDTPKAKVSKVKGGVLLCDTAERKLLTLISMTYSLMLRAKKQQRKFEDPLNALFLGKTSDDEAEKHLFIGRIAGLQIVEKCDPKFHSRTCYVYVFEKEKWFAPHNQFVIELDSAGLRPIEDILLEKPETSLKFLQSKGYKILKRPVVGAIVAYFLEGVLEHYARVVSIDKGNVIVRSKWSNMHVYEGPVELVPQNFGSEVIFLI